MAELPASIYGITDDDFAILMRIRETSSVSDYDGDRPVPTLPPNTKLKLNAEWFYFLSGNRYAHCTYISNKQNVTMVVGDQERFAQY